MTASEHQPDPRRASVAAAELDGLEPAPRWVGDPVAAQRFASPRAIRAALLPEQVAAFDAAFDVALTAARETLSLDQLRSVLRMWRRQALMTERDPEGHRRILATTNEVQRSGRPRPGSVPWSVLKAELGI
jgi:hypothetical protein